MHSIQKHLACKLTATTCKCKRVPARRCSNLPLLKQPTHLIRSYISATADPSTQHAGGLGTAPLNRALLPAVHLFMHSSTLMSIPHVAQLSAGYVRWVAADLTALPTLSLLHIHTDVTVAKTLSICGIVLYQSPSHPPGTCIPALPMSAGTLQWWRRPASSSS